MLAKEAKLKTKLQPHQQRVVSRILDPDTHGLIVAHGLGSGKTLSAIAAQDALGLPADVVVPASLQANYAKELKKHRTGGPETNIESLQNLSVKGLVPKRKMLVVDEAHRLREPGTKGEQTLRQAHPEKTLLLTGSPFYNRPSDISNLIDLASGQNTLPRDPQEFNAKYIEDKKKSPGLWNRLRGVKPSPDPHVNPKNREALRKILNKYIDYHVPKTQEGFPSVTHEDVKVPMSTQQLKTYDSVLGKAPYWVRAKVRAGLPPSKSEASSLNSFLTGVRQISNTTGPYQTGGEIQNPKIQSAFSRLQKEFAKNPNSKAVIYSNFLDAGINPYKKLLEESHIPYGEFTGDMPRHKRDELVKAYNKNKLKALLLSSAGGEGLDLKGTRLMQILEPHWNEEKLKQIEGRGVRYKSHEDLPPAERNVNIQRFLATRPPSGLLEKLKLKKPGYAVDEYLTQMSENKNKLNQEFLDLLENK